MKKVFYAFLGLILALGISYPLAFATIGNSIGNSISSLWVESDATTIKPLPQYTTVNIAEICDEADTNCIDISAGIASSIQDAAADGATKGVASFTASDFNAASGNISIDYTNAQKATDTQTGLLTELAIASEVNTGTDATRAVTPDSLAGSNTGRGKVGIVIFASDAAVTTGNGTAGIPITAEYNGFDVIDVQCNVYTKGITGTTDITLRRQRGATDVDVTSTPVTIGDEYFANDEAINTSNDDLATGDMLFFDPDAVHSGTAPNGLSCIAILQLP